MCCQNRFVTCFNKNFNKNRVDNDITTITKTKIFRISFENLFNLYDISIKNYKNQTIQLFFENSLKF